MMTPRLILVLLFVVCFTLATYLQPRHAAVAEAGGQSDNVLALLLGDGRRMFATQFYSKADAYFHRGKYPSIFDRDVPKEENHMAGEASHGESGDHDEDHDEHEGAGPPAQDWIERFGRHFYPSVHVHLEGGAEREMLPWLSISIELDPHEILTYAVAAYVLRDRLGKVDEAKAMLQAGLRSNPNDPQLLYQLGLCFRKENDLTRATNLWTAALRRWRQTEQSKEQSDPQLPRNILDELTIIALQEGQTNRAVEYLQQLKDISPVPQIVQKRIDDLRSQHPSAAGQ